MNEAIETCVARRKLMTSVRKVLVMSDVLDLTLVQEEDDGVLLPAPFSARRATSLHQLRTLRTADVNGGNEILFPRY